MGSNDRVYICPSTELYKEFEQCKSEEESILLEKIIINRYLEDKQNSDNSTAYFNLVAWHGRQ